MSLAVLNQVRTERGNLLEVNPLAVFNQFYLRSIGPVSNVNVSPPRSNVYAQPASAPSIRSSLPVGMGASIPSSAYQGGLRVQQQQQAQPQNLNVDINRLYVGPAAGRATKSYTVAELRVIAKQLGLPTAGVKQDLINAISSVVMK